MGNEIGLRDYDRANDSGRVFCAHTALEPLTVFESHGRVVGTRYVCINCKTRLDALPGTGNRPR